MCFDGTQKAKIELKNLRYVKFVTVILGRHCNGCCKYCIQSRFINTVKDEPFNCDIIDFLVELINIPRKNSNDKLQILLYGGEPFLYWRELKLVVQSVYEKQSSNINRFYFQVFTNGVLLDEKKVDFLNRYNVKVVLSYDGPYEYTRPIRLRDEQIPLFSQLRNRRVIFVFSYDNLSLFENMIYIKNKFKISDIDFAVCTYTEDVVPMEQKAIESVLKRSFSKLVRYYRINPFDNFLENTLYRFYKDSPLIENNQDYFLSLDLAGNLYAFSDLIDSKIGTIYDDCFEAICGYRMSLYADKCADCECNSFCRKHYSDKAIATCNLVKALYNVFLLYEKELHFFRKGRIGCKVRSM